MDATTITIGILAVAGLVVLAALLIASNRGRRRAEDVPVGRRPGYSDEQLEKVVIERYMAWGVVFTLVFAIGFPLYWVNEERRLNQAQEDFVVEEVVLGEQEYQQACAECHAPDLSGGAAADPYGDGSWPAPALNNIVARYADNPNVLDMADFIEQTIQRGRPGTPMPAWGAAFGGAMTDQQIEGIADFILLNQLDEEEVAEADPATNLSGEELYTQNCAKCHGADLAGIVGPSLVGVFDRHGHESILGILRNGIYVPTGAIMPPWQNGYMYADARFTDDALERVVEYLDEAQPPGAEGASDQQAVGDGEGEPAPADDDDDEDADDDEGADT